MPIPVVSVAQMREWEKVSWASGLKEDEVMRRAGQEVARAAERMTRPGQLVLFLAGNGHNGDDAAYAYDAIRDRQRELMRVEDPEVFAAQLPRQFGRGPALIVDGLFGIGLNRPLAGGWLKLIEHLNEAGVPILAVDVPSGLSADTGLPLEVAIRATVTLTLGAVKKGFLKTAATPFVGRLEVAPKIGLVDYPFSTDISFVTAQDYRDFPPRRAVAGHKGTFGHVAIVAGSSGYHGAAVLAARGAQRAQPGLVTLLAHESIYVPVASQLQAVMVRAWADEPVLPENSTAVLVGPGLAAPDVPDSLRRFVRRLWTDLPLSLIVDATALDWLPADAPRATALRLITPHPGEAARLLQCTTAEVQADRIAAARELSRRCGNCQVILKGHQTVLLVGKGPVAVNSSGNPHLAQGGSGDLLSGYLAGLLAQPALQAHAALTLGYGVWQHGAAADALLAATPAFTIEELAAVLGNVRGQLQPSG